MPFNLILNYRLDLFFFLSLSLALICAAHFIRKRQGSFRGMPPRVWLLWGIMMIAASLLAEKAGIDEQTQIIKMLQGFAPTYAQEMEQIGHEKMNWETSPDDPVYLSLIEAEKRWLKINPIVSDIYTFGRGKDGKAALLVDSETDYNQNGKYDEEREGRTQIGEIFPQQNESVARALSGEMTFDATPYTDRWGTWVTMYYPLKNSKGENQAALGVDYAANEWVTAVLLNRLTVFAFSFMGGLILIIYGLADSALRSRDLYFRALIENALDIVTVLNAAGEILFESPSIQHVLGYNPAEIRGKKVFTFIHPDDLPHVREAFGKMLQGPEQRYEVKLRFRHKDGSWRFMESIGTNLTSNPNVRGIIVNSRDITENRKAQQELELQRLRSLQHSKMASLGEMASGIAHEVNTPLGVIVGRAEQLKKEVSRANADPVLLQTCAEAVQEMAMRIAKIIRSLRSFSRNASEDPFSRSLLPDLVDDAVAICSERFKNHGIKLHVEKLPRVALDCRPAEITQVLLNLLSNASDAVENVTAEKRVSIRAVEEEKYVILLVSDSGPGIAPDLKDKVFEPFFTTKPVGKGTGLGLSICKGIIEAHHGTIFADGHAGDNRFCIRLPKIFGSEKAA